MNHVFIIAEIGVNHNGNIQIAKKLIDAAINAGADAVKFQSFKTENLVSKNAPKTDYQIKNTMDNKSQFEMLKKLELNKDAHLELIEYCKKKNTIFLSSPFDLESIDLLNNLGLEIFKIPSGEITNLPYLIKIAQLKKEVIISSGMSYLAEIKDSINLLTTYGTLIKNITVLHCNTEYPTPFEDVNLRAMLTIKNTFNIKVGYSDHTPGIEIPIAAVAMGAQIIEKHLTLDRNLSGPDHKASLEPDEFKRMVDAIRNIEISLGDGEKKPSRSEFKNIAIARKSIVALKDIKKGEKFTDQNITIKRPGNGISPMQWLNVLGKKANKDFNKDELIEL